MIIAQKQRSKARRPEDPRYAQELSLIVEARCHMSRRLAAGKATGLQRGMGCDKPKEDESGEEKLGIR